jgi:predicted N-acyltransferase
MKRHGCAAASNYSVQIWDSVDEIDVPAWESLRHEDDLFMDLRMLRVTAGSMVDTDTFSFLLIRDANRTPVAATCLWRFMLKGTLLAQDNWIIRGVKRISKVIPALNYHRVLVVGMPVSAGQNNLRFAPGVNRDEIMAVLNEKLMSVSRAEGLRYIIFKEFEQRDPAVVASFERLGYHVADSLPMNQFDATCNSFEAYLATLTSKKRSQIKNSYKKVKTDTLRLVVTSDSEEVANLYTEPVHQLYHSVLERAEARLEKLPPTFFRELSRQFGAKTSFNFIMEGDTVRAFGVVLYSDEVAYPLYVGVNYELNAEHELYFNVMFSMFEESLRRGVKLVSWGQTADQFKQMKLGCYQTPRHFFIKGTNRFSEALIMMLFPHLFPERIIAERPVQETEMKRAA